MPPLKSSRGYHTCTWHMYMYMNNCHQQSLSQHWAVHVVRLATMADSLTAGLGGCMHVCIYMHEPLTVSNSHCIVARLQRTQVSAQVCKRLRSHKPLAVCIYTHTCLIQPSLMSACRLSKEINAALKQQPHKNEQHMKQPQYLIKEIQYIMQNHFLYQECSC